MDLTVSARQRRSRRIIIAVLVAARCSGVASRSPQTARYTTLSRVSTTPDGVASTCPTSKRSSLTMSANSCVPGTRDSLDIIGAPSTNPLTKDRTPVLKSRRCIPTERQKAQSSIGTSIIFRFALPEMPRAPNCNIIFLLGCEDPMRELTPTTGNTLRILRRAFCPKPMRTEC